MGGKRKRPPSQISIVMDTRAERLRQEVMSLARQPAGVEGQSELLGLTSFGDKGPGKAQTPGFYRSICMKLAQELEKARSAVAAIQEQNYQMHCALGDPIDNDVDGVVPTNMMPMGEVQTRQGSCDVRQGVLAVDCALQSTADAPKVSQATVALEPDPVVKPSKVLESSHESCAPSHDMLRELKYLQQHGRQVTQGVLAHDFTTQPMPYYPYEPSECLAAPLPGATLEQQMDMDPTGSSHSLPSSIMPLEHVSLPKGMLLPPSRRPSYGALSGLGDEKEATDDLLDYLLSSPDLMQQGSPFFADLSPKMLLHHYGSSRGPSRLGRTKSDASDASELSMAMTESLSESSRIRTGISGRSFVDQLRV